MNGNSDGFGTKRKTYPVCLGTPIKKSPSTNEKGTMNDGNVDTGTVQRQTFSDFVRDLEKQS